jgi:1-acyl-sn-glycerol-3-phosphate acyltransferase
VLGTLGLPLLLLLGLTRPTGVRGALFLVWWLWCETVGVLVAGALTPLVAIPRTSHRVHRALQRTWSSALWAGLSNLYRLRLDVTGETGRPPFLLLVRHVSAADTLLPQILVANPQHLALRYVLKDELRWDPALDLVGGRLPNAFVRRGEGQTARVAALARDLEPNGGVVIWPEGTRFTAERRERILAKTPQASELKATLPPRAGGVRAALETTDLPVVFCAHRGLEGVKGLADLWNGELLDKVVVVHLWRGSPPPGGLDAWLLAQWRRVDAVATGAVWAEGEEAASPLTAPLRHSSR